MPFQEIAEEWLQSLTKPTGILKETQEEGRRKLEKVGFPSNKDESWRLTNLKSLEKVMRLPIDINKENSYEKDLPILPKKVSENVLQIFNISSNDDINLNSFPEGIRRLDEKEISLHLKNNIQNSKSENNKAKLINESSAKVMIALHISGSNIPPLEIITPSISNSLCSTRVLLIIEEKTNLNLVQVIHGSINTAQSNFVEIKIGKDANVNHGYIALGDETSTLLSNISINQEKDSSYSLTTIQKGWGLSRIEPAIIQSNGEAKTNLKGLQVSNGKEQLATHSYMQFDGPNGIFDQLNKSSANGNSHSIFNGAIKVPKIAQQTSASQLSRNLILSKRAKIDTKPELEIIADDVKCTHGATISQLQEEEIFYLRSRGIGSQEANNLLLDAYYEEILSTIPLYEERWKILNRVITNSKQ